MCAFTDENRTVFCSHRRIEVNTASGLYDTVKVTLREGGERGDERQLELSLTRDAWDQLISEVSRCL